MYKAILNKIRVEYKKKQFKKNSIVGENCNFDPYCGCINKTRDKSSIIIGDNCVIRGVLYAVDKGKLNIGSYTYIGFNTQIGAVNNVRIGDYVIISNFVRIIDNNNHPVSPIERKKMSLSGFYNNNWEWTNSINSPIIIEDNVWIGEFVRIMKGVTIGEGSIVGANAVVTKDVQPYTVVAGNPARIVKSLKKERI